MKEWPTIGAATLNPYRVAARHPKNPMGVGANTQRGGLQSPSYGIGVVASQSQPHVMAASHPMGVWGWPAGGFHPIGPKGDLQPPSCDIGVVASQPQSHAVATSHPIGPRGDNATFSHPSIFSSF